MPAHLGEVLLPMSLREILWVAGIVAAICAVATWSAAKLGAESERRLRKTAEDRKEPRLPS